MSQVSNQEPSTSSQYNTNDRSFLTPLFHASDVKIVTQLMNHLTLIHNIKNNTIPQVSSQEPSTSAMNDFKDRVLLMHLYSY